MTTLRRVVSNPDDFLGFCMAVGYIAQFWAMIEQNFDMWVAMIYHDIGGREIDPEIPRSFSKKVKFLRRSFGRIEAIKHHKKEARNILEEASNISKTRNDLVHGALTSLTPINGKWHMVIFDYEIDETQVHWHHARDFTFSPAQFQELEGKLVPLAGRAGRLGLRLRDEQQLRQSFSRHPSAALRSAPSAKENG